jgi:hypothetical protein
MKEISLKKPVEKMTKETMAMPVPKDSYPTFSCYDNAPDELMKIPMGKEVMAKIRKSSEDTHKGDKSRNSCGFEVISIMIKDDEKMKEVLKDVNMPEDKHASIMEKYKG